MPKIHVNDVEIAYDLREPLGSAANSPVMLLIQGLGMSSAAWPPSLIEALASEGFRVLTMDNRDIGRSKVLDQAPPNMLIQILRKQIGLKVDAPYLLIDMMRDAEGLLDELEIGNAHVVGVSMGGMIAQLLAIYASQRVRTLTSVMSTTGDPSLPGATAQVRKRIISRPKRTPEGRRQHQREIWKLLSSPEYPMPARELEAFLDRIFDRGMTAAGTARQMLAIMASPGRVEHLQKLNVPALVIHGEADPLIPIAGGYDTAKAIPGARMIAIPGMGHDWPEALVPRLTQSISQHAHTADQIAAQSMVHEASA